MTLADFLPSAETWTAIDSAIKHPLVPPILNAIIAVTFVQKVVTRWQSIQKSIECKTTLAMDVIKWTTKLLTVARFNELRRTDKTKHYSPEFLEWSVETAAVRAKIEAQLLDPRLAQQWRDICTKARLVYELSVILEATTAEGAKPAQAPAILPTLHDRPFHLNEMRNHFKLAEHDWEALASESASWLSHDAFFAYGKAIQQLSGQIYSEARDLYVRITDKHTRTRAYG